MIRRLVFLSVPLALLAGGCAPREATQISLQPRANIPPAPPRGEPSAICQPGAGGIARGVRRARLCAQGRRHRDVAL